MDSGNPELPGLWRTRPDLGAAGDRQLTVSAEHLGV